MKKDPLHSVRGGRVQISGFGKMDVYYPKATQSVEIDVDFEYLVKSIETNTPVEDDGHKVVIISNPENVIICSQSSVQEIKLPREHFLSYIS